MVSPLSRREGIALNQKISAAKNPRQVLDIAYSALSQLDQLHVTNVLNQVSKQARSWPTKKKRAFYTKNREVFVGLFSHVESMQMAPRNLATLTHALALLEYPFAELFVEISKKIGSELDDCSSRDVCQIAWSYATLKLPDFELFSKISERIAGGYLSLSFRETAQIAWSFSKLELGSEELFATLANRAILNMPEADAASLAQLSWAYGHIGNAHEALFLAIARTVKKQCSSNYQLKEIANILWGFGEVLILNKGLCFVLGNKVALRLREANSHDLATISGVMCRLEYGHKTLFPAMEEEIMVRRRLAQFPEQHLTTIFCAFVDLGFMTDRMVKAVGKVLREKGENFGARGVYKLFRAFGELGVQAPEMVGRVNSCLEEFKPEEVVTMLVSMAKQKLDRVEALCERIRMNSDKLKIKKIAQAIWAVAVLEHENIPFLDQLAASAIRQLSFANGHDLSQLLWGFSRLRHFNKELFSATKKRMIERPELLSFRDWANVAHALAMVNDRDLEIFDLILKQLEGQMQKIDTQSLVNILWSFLVVGLERPGFFAQVISVIDDREDVEPTALFQLHQFMILHDDSESCPPKLVEKIGQELRVRADPDVRSSPLQDEVGTYLRRIHKNIKEEFVISGMPVDFALTHSKIALEVNGPQHYLTDSRTMVGPGKLKKRLLEHLGWQLVMIPYWVWRELKGDQEKIQYLAKIDA